MTPTECISKIKVEVLPKMLFETSIILIAKPSEDTATKENYMPIFLVKIETKIHEVLAS